MLLEHNDYVLGQEHNSAGHNRVPDYVLRAEHNRFRAEQDHNQAAIMLLGHNQYALRA